MKTYEIKSGKGWAKVKGRILPNGWLEWKSDGCVGLKRPGTWRETAKPTQPEPQAYLPPHAHGWSNE